MNRVLVGGIVGVLVFGFVARLEAAEVSEATRCEIIKLKAVVKELKDKAQCYERSLKTNLPVPQSCLSYAEKKKARIFERIDGRGACLASADNALLSLRIDSFLRDVKTSLHAGGLSATPKSAGAKPPVEDGSETETKQAKTAVVPEGTPEDGNPQEEQ